MDYRLWTMDYGLWTVDYGLMWRVRISFLQRVALVARLVSAAATSLWRENGTLALLAIAFSCLIIVQRY